VQPAPAPWPRLALAVLLPAQRVRQPRAQVRERPPLQQRQSPVLSLLPPREQEPAQAPRLIA
jgi:hypothetical protein